ncbi:hypothetical protein UFOVP124_23 [uncultured Caudovirales phage]|uniref:Portal protein n=1 Tax=uncultured Caudovirales phage TaxID=2100421 RepID=A0A6J5L8A3_9CAUD|nr:hypothetical protein UFOVP124_23 [uncultured Caudovirales phage]
MKVLDEKQAADLVKRQHPEYHEFANLWRRIQDSLEGGDRYRFASYGVDPRDPQRMIHNLTRHKKEYPPPRRSYEPGYADNDFHRVGSDSFERAAEDSFKMRQARTPVPRFLHDSIQKHLSRIYANPIHREGPDSLVEFWEDVDGYGNTIDEWLTEAVAELFMGLGQIDILFDHPSPPGDVSVATQADVNRLGLDRCLATVILPENLTWWRKEAGPEYVECLIREHRANERGDLEHVFRHWDTEGSVLYAKDGKPLSDVIPHSYGRVPIIRIFDRRRARCMNVGLSRYEGVLEVEREYYNQDSELILSNTLQAHPTLQGPMQSFQQGNEIEVGPGGVLPIYSDPSAGTIPWSFVDPPKDAARFIAESKCDLTDRVDRMTGQTKPAGSSKSGGSGSSTVSQSGYSKELDQRDGNDLLAKIARSLRKFEIIVAEYALMVLTDGKYQPSQEASEETIEITYPGGFNLLSAEELATLGAEIQTFVASAGELPTFETELLCAMQRAALPGLDPKIMDAIEEEAELAIQRAAEAKAQGREAGMVGLQKLGEIQGEVEGEGQVEAEGAEKNEVPEDPIQTPPTPSYVGPQ